MNELLEYKGYQGKVVFDSDAGLFHGEVLHLRDVITFQGTTVRDLKRAFRDSVDDYLEYCTSRGESPEKPYSGKFVLRVSPELHKKLSAQAVGVGKSLNAFVTEKLEKAV